MRLQQWLSGIALSATFGLASCSLYGPIDRRFCVKLQGSAECVEEFAVTLRPGGTTTISVETVLLHGDEGGTVVIYPSAFPDFLTMTVADRAIGIPGQTTITATASSTAPTFAPGFSVRMTYEAEDDAAEFTLKFTIVVTVQR